MAKRMISRASSIKRTELVVTRFEDLSNELLYEIFDFFDNCYTYEVFVNLNNRFNYLITHSLLSLKFNFSLLSKATFQHRCKTILIPNIHRIISLRLSHHFLIDYFFTLFSLDSSFIRLESLTLDNAKVNNLIYILTTLASLPRLFFLTINSIEKIRSRDIVYRSIIRLPVLKYCKLSLDILNQHFDLSLNNNEYSPIEHLIIDSKCNLNELIKLLVYTPQLQRVSCKISTINSSLSGMSIIPINLNRIYLELEDTSFDEFEWFISNFSHQLQVLRISTTRDIEFLNANRWQRLITHQMPLLHKFSFQYQTIVGENLDDYDRYHTLMEKFNSSFWCNRQWFFAHQYYKSKDFTSWIRFYSTKPYRWNHYELYEDACQHHETGVNQACEVDLHSYRPITLQFSRVTRLILSEGNMIQNSSFIFDLTRIFSPTQLIELVISDEQLRLEQLLLLLHYFSNIKSLTIPTSTLNLSSPQSETNRLTFDMNNVSKVTMLNRCTLEDIQILHRFCPHLQSLEIEVEKEKLELILRFLLLRNTTRNHRDQLFTRLYSKNIIFWQQEYSHCIHCTKHQNLNSIRSPCNHHLSLLCCRDINYRMIEKLRIMIDQERLLNDYSIEYVDQKMYLWW